MNVASHSVGIEIEYEFKERGERATTSSVSPSSALQKYSVEVELDGQHCFISLNSILAELDF